MLAVLALSLAAFAACAAPAIGTAATCPNESSRPGASPSASLPDCRAYELTTPGLNDAAPATWPDVSVQGVTADGSAIAFLAAATPLDAEGATPASNTVLARRGTLGWGTRSLSGPTPLASSTYFGQTATTVGLSEDLTQSVQLSNQPLAGGASPSGTNLYLRAANGSFVALTKVGATGFNPGAALSGASSDFSHLFFTTTVKQPVEGIEDPLLNGNTYEWFAGQLHLVTILPESSGEEAAPAGGNLAPGVLPAVSEDGHHVIFKANGYPGLYLRSNATTSVEVSKSQRTPADLNPPANAIPAGIASDGSVVLFTSASELTEDANTGSSGGVPTDAGSDLYSYNVSSGVLTDLTVDNDPADEATGADVEGVLGASENGSYVYFVATGKLAEGATSGQRNIYVNHAGTTEYIAADPVGNPEDGYSFYVTPDGLHAGFTSAALRPGYNNAGFAQAYLYTYGNSAGLQCGSCRPGGEPAAASASIAGRAVSDKGDRLFFQSSDAIIPQAQSAQANVFEYSGGTVQMLSPGDGAPAVLLSASGSGDDVFIASYQELSPQGQGSVFAIYDARVNAEVPVPTETAPCQGEGCRGAGSPVAPEADAGSASFEAPARVSAPISKNIQGSKAQLRVIVPGAGTLTISGRGFAKVDKKPTKSGSVAFTLTLGKTSQRKLNRYGIFRTEAEFLFRSTAGTISRAGTGLIFSPAPKKKGAA